MNFRESLSHFRVLPVVTPISVDSTVQLAQTLSAAGMGAIEITLRSNSALDAIRAVRAAVPTITVAAGTVCRPADIEAAMKAGAEFLVSPGMTQALLEAAVSVDAPLLPGVASASDVMLGLHHGMDVFKLFPAVAVGGMDLLRSLAGPFPEVLFCPTGGLTQDNFRDFLALPNVVCCGGSWMVASALVRELQWDMIEELARQAMAD